MLRAGPPRCQAAVANRCTDHQDWSLKLIIKAGSLRQDGRMEAWGQLGRRVLLTTQNPGHSRFWITPGSGPQHIMGYSRFGITAGTLNAFQRDLKFASSWSTSIFMPSDYELEGMARELQVGFMSNSSRGTVDAPRQSTKAKRLQKDSREEFKTAEVLHREIAVGGCHTVRWRSLSYGWHRE